MANTKTDNNVELDEAFWNNRYICNDTGWDLGQVSPPIKAYIDQLTNKNLRILIPGCGNTYEAEYLLQKGFTHITVIDLAPTLVDQLRQKFTPNKNINIVLGDFFDHTGTYDLIIEQTFFCAIHPLKRKDYVVKMKELLADDGKLCGLMFNTTFENEGPPFGGNKKEYETLFEKDFNIITLETCYNSFVKRQGNELFVIMIKKS